MPAIPRRLMTVKEFLAWVPPEGMGVLGVDRRPPSLARTSAAKIDVVAHTPEVLVRLMDEADGGLSVQPLA